MENPYLNYLHTKYRFPRSLVHGPIHRFFARHLSTLPTGNRLLDAGCGNGIESGFHVGRLEVHGVDYQPEYIAHCRATYPAGHYAQGDLHALDYPDAHFAMVLMNQVIEHVEGPQVVISEMARVLRPGGLLLVATPNYGNFGWPLVERTYHRWWVEEFRAEEYHVTQYDPALLSAHLSEGLEVDEIGTVCLTMILVATARKPV